MNTKLTAKMTEVLLYVAATPAQRDSLPHPGRATNTCAALVTRGLITPGMNLWDHQLTGLGREALAEAGQLVLHVEPVTEAAEPTTDYIAIAIRAYIESEWSGADAVTLSGMRGGITAAILAADPELSNTAAGFRFWKLVAEMRDNDSTAPQPLPGTTSSMPCPRNCGVDVRNHHSSGSVNGGCDTGPMPVADMHDWFAARGVGQPGFLPMADAIAEHYGKTEDELNEVYDAMHGPIA